MNKGLAEMSVDIQTKAVILAPIETGALRASGKVTPVTDGYKISFGSSAVPYAKRRHFQNAKNPGTLRYLYRAGDGVIRSNLSKYFRKLI